jgi:hypothetical protein
MVRSAEDERSHRAFVGATAFSLGVADGANATAYTGPEWPIKRRELVGGSSALSSEGIFFPSRLQTRMYDSCIPAATSRLSSEKSRQLILT